MTDPQPKPRPILIVRSCDTARELPREPSPWPWRLLVLAGVVLTIVSAAAIAILFAQLGWIAP